MNDCRRPAGENGHNGAHERGHLMRKVNAWVLSATLVLALVLIWASATGSIGLSLPWAVVLGLGINVVLLFWEHRQKLHDFLGTPKS